MEYQKLAFSEKERKQYQDFFVFCAKKRTGDREKDGLYQLVTKMGLIYTQLGLYGLSRVCNLGGYSQDRVTLQMICQILEKAENEKFYKNVRDPYKILPLFKRINEICDGKDVDLRRAEQKLKDIEREIQEMGLDKILQYFMETFHKVWDKDEKIWKTFLMQTIFE